MKILMSLLLIFSINLHAQTNEKSYWLEEVSGKWEKETCNTESIFMKCYLIEEKKCYSLAVQVAEDCMALFKRKIPGNKIDNKLKDKLEFRFRQCSNNLFAAMIAKKYIIGETIECAEKMKEIKAGKK